MNASVSSRFSPRSLDAAQLERLTVARKDLIEQLQTTVVSAVVSNQARFDLVLGPRGAGKSHIIGVLEHRLRNSEQLAGRALIVAPPEELHPLSLVQFLALLLREFPDDPELGPAADAVRSLQRERDANQERRAIDLIRGRLAGQSLIILLENLDELFDALGRDGQLRLRNILQTERRWSIIATSRSLIPAFTKYEAPFHGTFNQHRLEPLSADQCRDMLVALAEAHAKPKLAELLRSPRGLLRVRGIHHLLDGNPRAMAFMFRQLDEQRLERFELALGDLADELKPYFQEQMTRLSPAQRAIVELLAENWRPLTVTEIVEQCFSTQASISGTLRQLRRDSIVQAFELGRERYYELGDPLHRLARANERPRDAIAAFARVVRHWFADDSDHDFIVRQYEILPKQAQDAWLAQDGGVPRTSTAESAEASQLLGLPPAAAIAETKRRLAARESPSLRAVLVLALERASDQEGAIEAFWSRPGVLDTQTQSWVVGCALTLQGVTEDPLSARPDSKIARAIHAVMKTALFPDVDETRRALLDEFDEASPAIVRFLSDLVVRSSLLPRWADQRTWTDFGELLNRLTPSRSSPSLERTLQKVVAVAWHHRRLAELLPGSASLDPLVEVLPTKLRVWLTMAKLVGLKELEEPPTRDEIVPTFARHFELIAAPAPDAELATTFNEDVLICTMVEILALFEREVVLGYLSEQALGLGLEACFYRWLASRRDLAPLARMASWVPEHVDLPATVLHAKGPREAVARLSEPERDLVRMILEAFRDHEGVQALGLGRTRIGANKKSQT